MDEGKLLIFMNEWETWEVEDHTNLWLIISLNNLRYTLTCEASKHIFFDVFNVLVMHKRHTRKVLDAYANDANEGEIFGVKIIRR